MNILEEIKAIWEQQHLDLPKDLNASIHMNEPDIFMSNAVEWLIEKHNRWVIGVQFDPAYHEVYQIDVIILGDDIARHRWVNPKYIERYHNNNFEYQIDDKHIKEVYKEHTPLKILDIARDAVDGITYNNDGTVNIPLDMTDAEIALIARAAHAEDITINEFMNKVVKEELDKVFPDWRDDVRASH